MEHSVRFSETLMELYSDYTIEWRNLFPGAGYVEMAIAAALKTNNRASDASTMVVELEDVSFLVPLDLQVGVELVCEHMFGEAMKMRGVPAGGGTETACVVVRATAHRAARALSGTQSPRDIPPRVSAGAGQDGVGFVGSYPPA